MERLTERDGTDAYYKKCFDEYGCDGRQIEDCKNCKFINELVCDRLAEYEDIGLTPSETMQMKEEFARLKSENEQLKNKLSMAVEDMKSMALVMREGEELQEGCCFACAFEAQNLPDNVMLAYGECPGYDIDDCFVWRGVSNDWSIQNNLKQQ